MSTSRPNILLITSDQHRADSLGCAQHPCVRTPHLDALAYEGTRFNQAYTDCPVCIPARTTLITGIQSHHYGMPAYNESFRIQRDRELFLGSLITKAGYQTHLAGKTHWHTEPLFRAGFESVSWMSYLRRARLIHSSRPTTLDGLGFNEMSPTLSQLPPELHLTDWVVDRSLDFLATRDRSQPFFLWTSLQDPHPPLTIHEPYYSMYANSEIPEAVVPAWCDGENVPVSLYHHRWTWNPKPLTPEEIRHARAVYYGMITNLDHQVGRLFAQLMADGDWENTLIVYLSDHGEHLGDHGDIGKTTFYESSARIPFIIRPPSSESGQRGTVSNALVQIADVLPTLCDYAGVDIPDDVDGLSLRDLIAGGNEERGRTAIHGQIEGDHMWRTKDYAYLYFTDDGSELAFDMRNDPRNEHPLTGEIVSQLRRQFSEHLREEEHPHIDCHGALLNRCTSRLSKRQLASAHSSIQGLSPGAIFHDMLRSIAYIN